MNPKFNNYFDKGYHTHIAAYHKLPSKSNLKYIIFRNIIKYFHRKEYLKTIYYILIPIRTDHVFVKHHLDQDIKAVPLHAMEALGGRGSIAPTHSRPRH
jgi:hypothetical protein